MKSLKFTKAAFSSYSKNFTGTKAKSSTLTSLSDKNEVAQAIHAKKIANIFMLFNINPLYKIKNK